MVSATSTPATPSPVSAVMRPVGTSAVTAIPASDGHVQRAKRRVEEADFRVEVVTSKSRLEEIVPQWSELAGRAVEPNPFYEHWFVLPSIDYLASSVNWRFLLVWQSGHKPGEPERLVALVPLERLATSWKHPVRCDRLWQHAYTYLCTPLVHAENTVAVVTEILKWSRGPGCGAHVLEFPHTHGEGPFQHALLEALDRQASFTLASHVYGRALFRRAESAEAYIENATTSHHRQELRRQRRRLSEQGRFEVRSLAAGENVDPWIETFLQLESSGWKGQEQTSLAASENDTRWFREVCHAAHARGQLMMLGLFVNDQPVAAKCNFLAGDGGFTFKIGFDEAYSKFSPGVQLEIENIGAAHQKPDLKWLDSCAAPGHFMISRLWPERRQIQRLLISTGRMGDLSLAARYGFRALRRIVKPPRPEQHT